MTESLRATARVYQPGDETGILESFNRIFAKVDPGFTPRTLEEWRWEFVDNPSGTTIYLAESEEGEIVCQFAGIPQRAKLEDRTVRIIHGVDSFLDPRFRRGLKSPLLIETAKGMFAHYCGNDEDRSPLMWGYPIWPAWRIGKEFLDEEIVRTESKLVARPDRLRFGEAPGVEIEQVERFPDEVDELFARATESIGLVSIRDAAQLNWRFPDRPGHDYDIALARKGGQLVGYAVLAKSTFDDEETPLIGDWLLDPNAREAGHALRHWAWERVRARGEEALVTIFPDTANEWLDFQFAGFAVQPTKYWTAATSWIHRGSMPWLYRNWYYTLEDTDLC